MSKRITDPTLELRYSKREAARRLKAQNETGRNAAIFNLTPEQYTTSQEVRDGRIVRDIDDGLEMSDDSCGECGHPYKRGDETHYPECSRIEVK